MADLMKGLTSPETVGLKSQDVLNYVRALDASENEIHGLVAARAGQVFAESYLAPYGSDLPHTCHSLGKSYTCTAMGIACTEGLLSPDDLVTDVFAEEIARFGATPDANMRTMKLRHLMSMSCGMERMPTLNEHWMENFLQSPVQYEPGTRFLYNSVGSCMLGAAVEKASGCDLDAYMREKLFAKIGIGMDSFVWRRFGNGRRAEPGISATTRANLRLGLFYLAQGTVEGERIIQREWMAEATQKQIDTDTLPGEADVSNGYGWQLWMCREPGMIRFDGGQGQFCIMDAKRNIAIAIHEGGIHPYGVQKVLDLTEALIASASDAPLQENPQAFTALTAYLSQRVIPSAKVKPIPENASKFCGSYAITGGVFNPWIEVAPVDTDFYHLFYEPSVRPEIIVMDIALTPCDVILTLNHDTVLHARLDGQWERGSAKTVLPSLGAYVATARFEDDHTLRVSLRWLNSWCCPELTFRLTEDSDLDIHIEKDMLHQGRVPFTREATARKVR